MTDTPPSGGATEEPGAAEQPTGPGDAGSEARVEEQAPTAADADRVADEPAPTAPAAPEPPPAGAGERGQRRITRETHNTTTRSQSQTTTHETSTTVEDIAVAPPVYAAPVGEHPRPVG
ncbi:hypothetical protein SAMN04488107_0049 [Geodermatophilus saharensis]|uniref:Uncharacterized protein n=1 Tax=Geodermatophilus saharensis TaxID=1137994 RepID=A0A238ZGA9_9ACTN|nr:hypothetical protein [Geodermatophilus saharensis]SNR82162.1 hypothetical protein SAMN04488107_0049 [Geodermatophilus saharensis]